MKKYSFLKTTLLCLLVICLSLLLIACATTVKFTISFDVDGTIVHTIETDGKSVIEAPANPVKAGYTFDGWYWDKDTWQKPFTINSLLDAPISSDMAVYAKFSPIGNNGGENSGNNGGNETPDPNAPHSHNYLKVPNGATFTMTCSCGDVLKGYRIQFVWAEDGSNAEDGIEVSWIDQNNNKVTATTNADGYVENLELTADSYALSINEKTLPVFGSEKYWVNDSAFATQYNGVGLTIPLIEVKELGTKDSLSVGDNTYDYYNIQLNKAYVATLKNANEKIWFLVENDTYGKYTVDATFANDVDVTMQRYYGSVYYVNPNPDSKIDVSEKNKMTYTVIVTDANQHSLFCLSAPSEATYPVTVPFSVSITYTPEIESVSTPTLVKPTHFQTEGATYTYYTVNERDNNKVETHVVESLKPVQGVEKCADVEGSVIKDLTAEQLETIQLRADGYYYTSDNKLVYAKLDVNTEFFLDTTLTIANFLGTSGSKDIYSVSETHPEYGYYTRMDNYFGFVQAYAALVNSDGLYPLTKELYDYLNIVAKKEHQDVAILLCTYPKQVNNFTVGSGTESTPYVLDLNEQTFGNYSVSIPSGGKVYLTLNATELEVALTFNSNVKVMVGSSTEYNGTCVKVEGSKTITLETKDGSALDFVLTVKKYRNPKVLEVGTNQDSLEPNSGAKKEFVAPTAGSYDISVSTSAVTVTVTQTGEDPVELNGTLTIVLAEGETLAFRIASNADITIEYNIYIVETPENE